MNMLFIFSFVVLISFLFTMLIINYALKKNILDVPNERSSHSISTPRGGGLSIVFIFLFTIAISDFNSTDIVFAIIGAGILVATVGFFDDQGHIAAKWRLLSHFMAAFWVMFYLGAINELQFSDHNIYLGWVGIVICAFSLVWLLNLFNFMDGIDGIAASETIFVSSAGAYFSWISGFESQTFISVTLAASTLGFLFLNWHPAKIFMGDVGSGFLGLMVGIIAYASILEGDSVWVWVVLLGVFIVDSGITLFRRIFNGDKWYEAHCSHAYQHAARKWGHKRVTIATILINIFWLFPIAYLVYFYPKIGGYLALSAYVPLIILALKFQAGTAVVGNNDTEN